jgi:Kelch motif/Galactose oxidase, central domain
MNDERPFELLASHEGPVEVDAGFEGRLYAVLQQEMHRPERSMRTALLLAAAVLAIAALTAAVAIGSGLIDPPWVDRLPIASPSPIESAPPGLSTESPAPTSAPSRATWTSTGPMSWPHTHGTATLLPDGTVLVVGGDALYEAELFDPVTGTWTAVRGMHTRRSGHTATLLPDGTVLVAGGYDDRRDLVLRSAEVYDPDTGTWTLAPDMAVPRSRHSATLLLDGTVLIAGGDDANGAKTSSSELYVPEGGTWTSTSSLITPGGGRATLLPSGQVLMTGGALRDVGGGLHPLADSELYDPVSGRWTATASLAAPGVETATTLLDGTVLVTRGRFGNGGVFDPAAAELYDPNGGTWTMTGEMTQVGSGHSATQLADGTVLVVGGRDSPDHRLASAGLYDPRNALWTPIADTLEARADHLATLLLDGRVLLAGGSDADGNGARSAVLYDPSGDD